MALYVGLRPLYANVARGSPPPPRREQRRGEAAQDGCQAETDKCISRRRTLLLGFIFRVPSSSKVLQKGAPGRVNVVTL